METKSARKMNRNLRHVEHCGPKRNWSIRIMSVKVTSLGRWLGGVRESFWNMFLMSDDPPNQVQVTKSGPPQRSRNERNQNFLLVGKVSPRPKRPGACRA